MTDHRIVVVLGASDKKDRYSNKAQKLLMEHGARVVPVHPSLEAVEGVPVSRSLSDISPGPDALTVYVKPETSSGLTDELVALRPKAVVFNPGTENPELEKRLAEAGIRTLRACSIMLLTTGRFDTEVFGAPEKD